MRSGWVAFQCVARAPATQTSTYKLFQKKKGKGKVHSCTGTEALYRPAHRGSRNITLLFLDHGNRRGWVVSSTPWPLFTSRKDPVPILQEAGWAPGPIWTAENLVPPTGLDPWTVQPLASRYTDWATRPTNDSKTVTIIFFRWSIELVYETKRQSIYVWWFVIRYVYNAHILGYVFLTYIKKSSNLYHVLLSPYFSTPSTP